jgi:hypothetical protein
MPGLSWFVGTAQRALVKIHGCGHQRQLLKLTGDFMPHHERVSWLLYLYLVRIERYYALRLSIKVKSWVDHFFIWRIIR